jgi:hypothetical protein
MVIMTLRSTTASDCSSFSSAQRLALMLSGRGWPPWAEKGKRRGDEYSDGDEQHAQWLGHVRILRDEILLLRFYRDSRVYVRSIPKMRSASAS